jgi:DNA-binding transcriptional ArsR family regulator
MWVGSKRALEIVNIFLSRQGRISAGELAREAKITRQAAHRHLAGFVKAGLLIAEGKGRGSRYRASRAVSPAPELRFQYPLKGLAEDVVWNDVRARIPRLAGLPDNVERILHYAITELVNNAIDHSDGSRVDLVFPSAGSDIVFEIMDDGVGVFDRLKAGLNLPDAFAAVQELSKGKTTTAPQKHTGEGIFFTSKAADFFELESGTVAWRVDNLRSDTSIASRPPREGTRVRFEVGPASARSLAKLFAEFSKTRIFVKLFEAGVRFVSRSEAKRVLRGLERFREVVLDFQGVLDVGQGFADEIFRVWPSLHPDVTLVPENMAAGVEFMIRRARKG